MRLHHLEATAFGPFADTVRVDFDELSEAGLFLLSGPTGAGKTSVLDAVCFALYGDVPGDRSAAKRLRCDQAPPGLRPLVSLEVTLGSRRFRLVRSPAWERPKKRGEGMTTEPAAVAVSELVGGDWQPLSTRLDETGDLVARLTGLTLTQFTQVALLPQGRFQAFLRARSDERHRLLQQLFRTGRFEQVERWLRDRRLELRRACGETHQAIADLVSRLSETTADPLPDSWDVGDLGPQAIDGSLTAWVAERRAGAATGRERAEAEVVQGAARELDVRSTLEAARAQAQRRARIVAASEEHASLLVDSDRHEERQRTIAEARKAATITPLHRRSVAAGRALSIAERCAAEAVARVATLTGRELSTSAALAAFVTDQVDTAARLRALQPRAVRLREISGAITTRESELLSISQKLQAVAQRRELAPAGLARLRSQLAEAENATLTAHGAALGLSVATERLTAHEEAAALSSVVLDARTAWQTAQSAALTARESWLSVKEARLESMAAEIAGQLAVGACCPVCGSAEHPAKASHASDAPDATAEKAALRSLDDAKATEHLRELELRDLETRLELLRAKAGAEPEAELREAVATLTAETHRLDELSRQAEGLRARLAEAEAAGAADDELARQLEAQRAAAEAALGALRSEAESLTSELASALGPGADGEADLEASLDRHLTHAEAGRVALEALTDRDVAEAAYADAERELTAAATAQGFPDVDHAVAAAIGDDEVERLAAAVARHEQRLAAVAEVLAEPGAQELAAVEVPDVDGLAEAHAEVMRLLAEAQSTAATWTWRERRLSELADQLADAVAAWRPVHDEHELVTRLSSFVEGKAVDNRLQMRLSAYVLAYRLSQVVAAANLRLAKMSDQRYSLEHTAQRGAGETRGGLSLQVRDDWSGESRDPATLSGGETFVVSLALALGLADVITQESDAAAEGSRLETLFVDEGFGSLDADTLDDVMDTLDSLRDGGRVVGVVSHVAEMRDRIPTQLLVSKSRSGSTLAVRR